MAFPRLATLRLSAAVLALLLASAAPVAWAQETGEPAEEAPAPGPTLLPPAYEKEMLRLSEILGSLHYLRELCGAKEGQLWRDQMQELIEREEPTAERRASLIAQFNRGYRGFREIYRDCTPAAASSPV